MARATFVALLLTAFALAGCARSEDTDSDSDGTSTQTGTGTGGSIASGTVSGSVSVSGTGSPGNGTHQKDITDNAFPNGNFTIQRGDTVTWTNKGDNPHSVTSDVIGAFDSNLNCAPTTTDACLQNGDSWTHKFEVAGVFPYHCKIHSSMRGTLTVEG